MFKLVANLIGLAKFFPFLIAMTLLVDQFNIHMIIHAVGIALATAVAIVSINVYLRDRRPKILLLTIAFLFLGAQQVIESFESLGLTIVNTPLPFVGIEFSHAVSVGAIVFLAAGVLKKA